MRSYIFPYKTISRDLALTVTSVQYEREIGERSVKERPSDAVVDFERNRIDLWNEENNDWTGLLLAFEVEYPANADPQLKDLAESVEVVTVVACRKSHLRLAIPMRLVDDSGSKWQGVTRVDRRQAYGKLELQAFIYGKALDRDCRYFGESNPWQIYFDKADSLSIHGALPVQWVNFSTDPDLGHLKEFSDEAFFLDINEAEPIVYLNQGLDGLRTVFMEHPRPTGTRLALLETLKTSIAKSVWFALFTVAMDNLSTAGDGEEDLDWPSTQWQEDVLKRLLPYIYPHRDEAGMLAALADDVHASMTGNVKAKALAYIASEVIHEGHSLRVAINQVEPSER